MLQNPCKTLGFKKNMVYKIPPGGEVNHIQPVAYMTSCSNVNLEKKSLKRANHQHTIFCPDMTEKMLTGT